MRTPEELGHYANRVRTIVLEQSMRAGVGHIGSALSIVDLVAVIFGQVLAGSSRIGPDRDRFILSKGHAALALYAALFLDGLLDEEQLNTYCGDASLLGVHPEHHLPGIDFSTGSLGQGLSFAVGSALAARIQGSHRRIITLLSDAECNEGSVWEAAQFAARHKLSRVVAVVDLNGQQALGYTDDVLGGSLPDRWRSFGWDVREVNGHDLTELAETFDRRDGNAPSVILAKTTFGRGVSFMERAIPWHYLPMTAAQFHAAMAEIEAKP